MASWAWLFMRSILSEAAADAFGEAAQRAHHAHALAGIILQEIAQPFLLHPDQPRNALATLQLVQGAAIALQAQIGAALRPKRFYDAAMVAFRQFCDREMRAKG